MPSAITVVDTGGAAVRWQQEEDVNKTKRGVEDVAALEQNTYRIF